MDYRQFLQEKDEMLHLPYFGRGAVCDDRRSWRVRAQIDSGWYRFCVSGRFAEPVERIDSRLPDWESRGIHGPLRGYHALGRFVGDLRQARLYCLPVDEDLERFSPVAAWEWFDGNLLFGTVEFESGVESAVREAYENDRGIEHIKAVTPALANAFLLENATRQLIRQREEEQIRRAHDKVCRERVRQDAEKMRSLEGRIAHALSLSGAVLVDWRRQGGGQIVVRYRLAGQRFECVIDSDTFQIVDAGICLEGSDWELSLSSLPSAVQEAIETGQLHVFRRG